MQLSSSKTRAGPWTVFAVAIATRLIAALALGHYRDPALWENGVIAGFLYAGDGFRMDYSLPAEPTSSQAPGYPYLLWLAWTVAGRTPQAYFLITLIQIVLLASIVFPMYALTARWLSRRAAIVAMWATCFIPLYVWYATRLHQAPIVMAAHPWLVYWWVRLRDEPSWHRGMAVGAVTGIAGLFQPVLLGVFGLIGAGATWAALRRSRRGLPAFAAAALAVVVVLLPWTIRNYRVHGRFVAVKDTFGKEFWMGNNPRATGTSFAEGGTVEITFAHPPRAFALRGRVPEIQLIDAMTAEALAYVRADPAAFLKRTAQKIVWFWSAAPSHLVRRSMGGEALRFRSVLLAYWTALVVFSAAALILRVRAHPEYRVILAAYVVFYTVLYGITHVGQARYRGEMEFILVPLASAGLLAAWDPLRRHRRDRTGSR